MSVRTVFILWLVLAVGVLIAVQKKLIENTDAAIGGLGLIIVLLLILTAVHGSGRTNRPYPR